MDEILEIKDLEVSFSDPERENRPLVRAVDRATLSVRKGSFTSIVGESGSGKTVTALSIGRLSRPYETKGEITYEARDQGKVDLLKLSEDKLREIRGKEIAYIFQDPATSLNPVLKVGEQIAEAYSAHFECSGSQAKAKVIEYLAAVKLKDSERIYQSFPHELSGGMKQRAMIAMALISEPKILIADEPTTALDVTTESEIMALLMELRKLKKLTILFITHDLSLAMNFSDEIYVMQKGRVAERMEKEAGGFKAREVYTKKLFNAQMTGLTPKSFIEV